MARYHQILLLTFSFFVLLILIAVFHDEGILTVLKLQDQMTELKKSNTVLYEKNLKIHADIEALKSNPLAVEKLAREKFNWVKPGETVYQIVQTIPAPQSNP
ncbi:MAG: hypothetical protein NPINA01_13570 [Nitrospinaceae bacterium]|nr:MAG: hypothetical protein NPINA01_13570 [Nitrospinaceae bacterium]